MLAQEEARLLNHGFIGTEHLLLGLIHEDGGAAAAALERVGVTLNVTRVRVEEILGVSATPPTGSPPFTTRAVKVLELSQDEALQLGHEHIGTEHLLLGVVSEGEGVAAQVLEQMGVDLGELRQTVIGMVSEVDSVHLEPGDEPRQFVRTVPGSDVVRTVMEGSIRVLSVEIYDTAVAVSHLWTVPEKWRADIQSRSFFIHPTLTDDVGTSYERIPGDGVLSTWELYGRAFFTPAPPARARLITVDWSGEARIDINMDPELRP